jgi:hypothetical protein
VVRGKAGIEAWLSVTAHVIEIQVQGLNNLGRHDDYGRSWQRKKEKNIDVTNSPSKIQRTKRKK